MIQTIIDEKIVAADNDIVAADNDTAIHDDARLTGIVIEEQKNYYVVSVTPSSQTSSSQITSSPQMTSSSQTSSQKTTSSKNLLRCTLKGALLNKRNFRISCGDVVRVKIIDHDRAADRAAGVICEVLPRKNFLPRPPLANLTQVIFINTFKQPRFDAEAADRFLFSAAVYEIDAVIIFNKMDLLNNDDARELKNIARYYEEIGHKIIYTSAENNLGIGELVDICADKTSAFTGLSGVGKSSLLSLIFPGVEFVTNEVSGARGRGTHTTTHTKLFASDARTFIGDTPGFAFVDIPTVDEDVVASYFPEIEKVTGQCKFNNCVHDAEPGCKVVELVDANKIAPWRRGHYLKIYREMVSRRRQH